MQLLFYNGRVDLNHWITVNFIIEHYLLVGLAITSGTALLLPSLLRQGAKVSSLQATQLINQGKSLILDVREPAEFATGHLRDAKNIALAELPKKLDELAKFKAKPVIVVCQSGVKSAKATALLKNAGFTEAVSLNGGVAAWQEQGLPMTKA